MQANSNENRIRLIKALGRVIKSHRVKQNKTIYGISAESSMSKSTWREAELGLCSDINLSTLWKISEGLNIKIYELLREVTKEIGENFSLIDSE